MTIYIVDIEAVDTLYKTVEGIFVQLQKATNKTVKVISGGETSH